MGNATHTSFRSWLEHEMQTQGVARRQLARRLAAKHPLGVTPSTIETYRRAIYRYLDPTDPMRPNAQTRVAFADALGVDPDEVPASDDEEDEDLDARLLTLTRELSAIRRALGKTRSLA